mmetsp:Transcript_14201/g.32201  ORF Transcript_14201/g.32201 Transcript_14201/m.32201 type:complete len:104 (+) Transcript_14201:553-864(+)
MTMGIMSCLLKDDISRGLPQSSRTCRVRGLPCPGPSERGRIIQGLPYPRVWKKAPGRGAFLLWLAEVRLAVCMCTRVGQYLQTIDYILLDLNNRTPCRLKFNL